MQFVRETDGARLSVGKRFGKLRPEEEKASRKADVKETEAIRQMKAAWRVFNLSYEYLFIEYERMLPIVEKLQYTAKDIEEFSLVLSEFRGEENLSDKAGLFLSALINGGKESDYLIHTYHLDMPPNYLGYQNDKNITVKGDGGDFVGVFMNGGSITVKGDVRAAIGFEMNRGRILVKGCAGDGVGRQMKDGSITIEGEAKDYFGRGMKGGNITVKGDARYRVGWRMKGGSITVVGNVEQRVGEQMKGGRIIIESSAGDDAGWWMQGGSITVVANAGHSVGYLMEDGEIHIHGDYADISNELQGGKIFHKGKLIKAPWWERAWARIKDFLSFR
jgi:formylmethanofuran dehydrogenase subunit C